MRHSEDAHGWSCVRRGPCHPLTGRKKRHSKHSRQGAHVDRHVHADCSKPWTHPRWERCPTLFLTCMATACSRAAIAMEQSLFSAAPENLGASAGGLGKNEKMKFRAQAMQNCDTACRRLLAHHPFDGGGEAAHAFPSRVPSCPRLSRASTSSRPATTKDVDGRHKACARAGLRPDPSAGHDE